MAGGLLVWIPFWPGVWCVEQVERFKNKAEANGRMEMENNVMVNSMCVQHMQGG